MTEPRKIVEAEVVRETGQPARIVEHVTARRIPGGAYFARTVYADGGDPELMRRRLRDLKLRMWLFLAGFAAIAGGCFYGAAVIETVFFAAFLIVTGIVMLLCVSVTYLLIRLVSRIPTGVS